MNPRNKKDRANFFRGVLREISLKNQFKFPTLEFYYNGAGNRLVRRVGEFKWYSAHVKTAALDFRDAIIHDDDPEFRHPDRLKFRSPDYVFRGFKNGESYLYKLDKVDPTNKPDFPIGFAVFIKIENTLLRSDNFAIFQEKEAYSDWHESEADRCKGVSYRAGVVVFRTKRDAERFKKGYPFLTGSELVIRPVMYEDHITAGNIDGLTADVVSEVNLIK